MLMNAVMLVKETVSEWVDDRCARLGAALAFYSIFSIAPLLIIAIAIAGMVFGEEAARGEIVEQIGDTIGPPAAKAIEDMLAAAGSPEGSVWATILGIAILLLAASGVFLQLQDALNTIWRVTPKPGRTLANMVRERFLSFSVVFGAGFLLLVSLVVSAGLAALTKWLTPSAVPGGVLLWQAINFLISLGVITLLFAMIFKLLPDVNLSWRDVWFGAAATALLFSVGKFLIGLYLGQTTTSSAYGAAGSLVILLLWVYYSSQIVLLGAELTRVHLRRRGIVIEPRPNAVLLTCDDRIRQGLPVSDEPAEAPTLPARQRRTA